MRPEKPLAVTTEFSNLNIKISWQAPVSNYQPITAYRVLIATRDLTAFFESKQHCDGARFDHSVRSLWCSLPVKAVLEKEPFNYQFDDLVRVKIQAKNSRGWSDFSDLNLDGVRIQSAPLSMSLPTRDSNTNTKSIFISWQQIQAPQNGNSPVTSYSLEYDAGTDGKVWSALCGYLTDFAGFQFKVTENIERGKYLQFRLRARNMWGWGQYSQITQIQAATRPLQATNLVASVSESGNFRVEWSLADDQGSALTETTLQIWRATDS